MSRTGPRKRDPGAARARILAAATAEFAACGFAGARVDRIAAAAGLNKRMLYHYFNDKRGLYRAVLAHCRAGAGVGADAVTARLLLWALLEPETAAEVRQHLDPEGAAALEADLGGLAARLLGGGSAAAPRARKPRIRLRRRTA